MKNISFAYTTRQFRNRTKTVTRRKGWLRLKPGQYLRAVEKGMGLKKGEKVKVLGTIRVLSVRREPLEAITMDDVIKEGFDLMTPESFVDLYIKINGGDRDQVVTRIEFEYAKAPK